MGRAVAFYCFENPGEHDMGQQEIDQAVADVTGEKLGLIRNMGFGIADPFEVAYDPEPRGPLVFDWDSMAPEIWTH